MSDYATKNTNPLYSQPELQALVKSQGEEIFKHMKSDGKSIFNKDWWYGKVMDWSMKNDSFKTQMFRFVDVLPCLNSNAEVASHLKEYFASDNKELPSIFNVGVGIGALAPGLLAGTVKKNITQMAKMFITGATPKEAIPVLNKARKKPIAFTVDLLGEATLSETEALDYQKRYIELLNELIAASKNWKHNPLIDEDENGEIPKVNISVKMTSIYSQIKDVAWEASKIKIKDRLRPIYKLAKDNHCFVNLDMEDYEHKDLTLEVFKELICEDDFKSYPHFGIVIQAYLKDSLKDTTELVDFARERQCPFTVRLVKGAYWDYEVIHANQMNWPVPVYTQKAHSDFNFEQCAHELIKSYPLTKLAIGSHNVRSIAAALVLAKQYNIPQKSIEVQMLFGMADTIKNSLIHHNYRLREYATVGELIPGMAYLVRRLLENTSNESFLRSKFVENESMDQLLAAPKYQPELEEQVAKKYKFNNEALIDFTHKSERQKVQQHLEAWPNEFNNKYPLFIDGKDVTSHELLDSLNPSEPSQTLGQVYMAQAEHVDQAVQSAKKAQKSWSKTPAVERANLLDKLADLIQANRYKLMSLQTLEVGKPWGEADGDITEAIDFCRYYAKDMRELSGAKKVGKALGETSHYHYRAKGVSAVIAPWNFPLAILTGMVAASLVTGNTVVIKPAEQSSLTAAWLIKLLQQAGFPLDTFQFLPGRGETIGKALVEHPDVNLICFTGSKEVGLEILSKSSQVVNGQQHTKKCIIEMGGKNGLIIDNDADLDQAVSGAVYSAFGFQGQKCSACSRVIVLEGVYQKFLDRLIDATTSIVQDNPKNPESFLGPVIDKEAYQRIQETIERYKGQHTLAYQGPQINDGYFIPPTIFSDVTADSDLAQKEIFGPVLAVIKAKNLDDAIQIANSTEFALTGGIYSRNPAHIEKVKEELEVGNLYINRSITGAMVERHPFGGYKLSGLGSKTGGPDYLRQFMEPRCITENTMRRGFAPSEDS